ncbi:hypothetical protein [Mesorhizobium wenxiniae]|uniref:hypothetical protein n=1 Tax=Mesorhizobium wenxiniae TaxID=2014805 RepID=UPI0013FD4B1F|nr:hypothetical protein [Mesorhizobium wenxiniae]
MTIIQKLAELGFTDATDLGSKNGKTLVRVRTSKGWAYERFASVDDVVVWARGRTP